MRAEVKSRESGDLVRTNQSNGKWRQTGLLKTTIPVFRLKQILVPMDFSENSRKALRYAERFAEEFEASIVLLHVVEPMMHPEGRMIVPAALEGRRVARMDQREARLDSLRQQEIGKGIKADV